jgi:uncharacterized RDD family membrane protein YckC
MYPQSQSPLNGSYNPYQPPSSSDWSDPSPYGGHHDEHILAERGTRLGAALVDGLLMVGAMLPGILLLVASDFEEGTLVAGIALLALCAGGLAIYQMVLISTRGQSIAKRWLGIRIVRLDGSPCGFVHGVLLRQWAMAIIAQIPIVGGIASIVDPLMIFGEERRCLHDQIAGTKVVVAHD